MYDADALEAINVEQLVTATDRLLLRGGQMSKRRHVRRFAEGSQPHIVVARFAEGSQPYIAVAAFDEPSQPYIAVAALAEDSQLDAAACAGDDTRPDIAIAGSGDDTRPDVAIAWETTVPHPVPRACNSQPYLGTIVAAPFSAAPHPAPPVCRSHLAYLATAPDLARGAQSELADIAAVPFAADSYPARHGRASQPCLASIAVMPAASDAALRRTRGSQQSDRTAVIRRVTHPRVQVFAVTVVIPALVGIVVGLAALL
jgi:hypothetical protein